MSLCPVHFITDSCKSLKLNQSINQSISYWRSTAEFWILGAVKQDIGEWMIGKGILLVGNPASLWREENHLLLGGGESQSWCLVDLTIRSLTRGLISLFFSLLNMKFAQQVCVPVQIPPAVRFLRQKYAGLAVGIRARRALTTERIKVKFQIARGSAGLCSVFNISLLAYPLGWCYKIKG